MNRWKALMGSALLVAFWALPIRAQLIPILSDARTGNREVLGATSFSDFRNADAFELGLRYTHPLTRGFDITFDGGFRDQDRTPFSDDEQAVYFGPGVRIGLATLAEDQFVISLMARSLVYTGIFDFGLDAQVMASVDLAVITLYGGVGVQHEEFETRGDDTLESGFIGFSLPLQQATTRFLLEIAFLEFEDTRLAGGVSYRF